MGNFSVSHYTALRVHPRQIEVRHVLDLAEIPAFQAIQDSRIVPEAGHPTLVPYLARRADALREGLRVEVDRRPLELTVVAREVLFTPGVGGLPTMKLGFTYRAVPPGPPAAAHLLTFADTNWADRVGWKEIIAVPGAGVVFEASSVPERDRSAELTDYPTDLAATPPQQLEARLVFGLEPGSAAAPAGAPEAVAPRPRRGAPRHDGAPPAERHVTRPATARPAVGAGVSRAPDRRGGPLESLRPVRLAAGDSRALRPNRLAMPAAPLAQLLAKREASVAIVLAAALVAAGLGALHALEPGHGKTVVAAYLVGTRGTAWHAVVLGLAVTLSHTAGVYLLGALVLYASSYVVPERLYPWLAVSSGLLIAGVGIALLRQRLHGAHHDHAHVGDAGSVAHPLGAGVSHGPAHRHHHHDAPAHDHQDGHGYTRFHGLAHAHGPGAVHVRTVPSTVSPGSLIALGLSGGIVPCPAALVVLLSAVSLNRAAFGLLLIVAFSAGLAAVLIAIGLFVVHARRLVARIDAGSVWLTRWLPLTSAAVVTLLGMVIAVQAMVNAGLPRLS
jgi:ABC-type nickel/cobalt efflux system permease component RcnA